MSRHEMREQNTQSILVDVCYLLILLKKSVTERLAFRQLKNRSISALLRKNQDRSVF
jgi:hypothetical protein